MKIEESYSHWMETIPYSRGSSTPYVYKQKERHEEWTNQK